MENNFEKAPLIIKYGDDVNSINALTISAAIKENYYTLKTISDLLNRLNSTKIDIQIKIKPFEKGSFKEIWEISYPILPFLPEIFRYSKLAKEIIDYYLKLIEFRKFLKGEEPINVTDTANGLNVENINGENKIIQPTIYNINGNPIFNNYSSNYFNVLDSDDTIKKVVYVGEHGKETLEISKDDIGLLSKRKEIPANLSRTIEKNNVNISIRVDLNNKKKITFYSDGSPIETEIKDQRFIEKVEEGEHFATGDLLTVNGILVQEFDDKVKTYLNKKFEINSVINHKHLNDNLALDFKE